MEERRGTSFIGSGEIHGNDDENVQTCSNRYYSILDRIDDRFRFRLENISYKKLPSFIRLMDLFTYVMAWQTKLIQLVCTSGEINWFGKKLNC